MKKNKMMRLGSTLLVATLASTCVLGGTFAKYVTETSGTDSARVAKWGFTGGNTITLDNLFEKTYTEAGEGAGNTVVSEADVIAPGTEGSATFGFTYGGQNGADTKPEVAYTFKVDTTESTCDTDIQNNKNIVWSLDGAECTATVDKTSWAVLLDKIEALDGAEGPDAKDYAPGELPAEFNTANKEHTVSWQWKFEDADNMTTQDAKDTTMGNKDKLDEVKLVIKVTATQKD